MSEPFWNAATVDPSQRPDPIPESVLAEHLGHRSQFVGLMDTEDKVQAHLDAVAQYKAVQANLLADYEYEDQQVRHPQAAPVVTGEPLPGELGSPEMDEALALDQVKLEELGAFDPAPQLQAPGKRAQAADHRAQIEAARTTWKNAINTRNQLMAEWDVYIKQCHEVYKQLRGK